MQYSQAMYEGKDDDGASIRPIPHATAWLGTVPSYSGLAGNIAKTLPCVVFLRDSYL